MSSSTVTENSLHHNKTFDRFKEGYEIPAFMNKPFKTKLTIYGYFAYLLPWLNRLVLITQIPSLKKDYPANLVQRAKAIGSPEFPWINIATTSLMIEIIRIIRTGLIDSIPGMRAAVMEVFDLLPLNHKDINLKDSLWWEASRALGNAKTPEIFAKFVANMCSQYQLTERQKDRIQLALKNYRDRDLFNDYVFNWIRQRDVKMQHPDLTIYFNRKRDVMAQYVNVVLEVLEPVENKVGEDDLGLLLKFFDSVDDATFAALEKKYVESKHETLNCSAAFDEIHTMFCLYKGEVPTPYPG